MTDAEWALVQLLLTVAGMGWLAAGSIAPSAVGKEPRFPQLTMEQLKDQQRPLVEKIMKVSSVGLAGPYNPMLRLHRLWRAGAAGRSIGAVSQAQAKEEMGKQQFGGEKDRAAGHDIDRR